MNYVKYKGPRDLKLGIQGISFLYTFDTGVTLLQKSLEYRWFQNSEFFKFL